jgi:hypothetical protein
LFATGAAGVDLDLAEIQGVHGVEDEVDEMIGGHPVAQVGREQQRGVAVNRNEAGRHAFKDAAARKKSKKIENFKSDRLLAAARTAWQREFAQVPAGKLVFLDESAAQTNMTRLRGRAPRGERVYDHAPAGHWRVTTLIGSIRLDGKTACMTIPAATDIPIFRAYVQPILIPTLQPGDAVIYDNLSSHQDPETTRLIEPARASVRPLPAYSLDLNPIEKMGSKVKALLRSAKARTPAALNRAIARALAAVTAKDAQGWFAAFSYSIN